MARHALRQDLLVADGDPDRFRVALEDAFAEYGSRFRLDVYGDDFEIVVLPETEQEIAHRVRGLIRNAEARSGARVRCTDARWDGAGT